MDSLSGLNLLQYLRKSREDLAAEARGEGDTLAKHRRALNAFVQKNKHNIIGVFEEVVSGERIVDRPEMQKMLHAMSDGFYNGKKIDGVLCIDEQRLGRGNMIDQGIIQDAFKSNNLLFVTPVKIYDPSNEFDEEWFEFQSFMGRRELKMITRRLQRGRRMSSAEGKHVAKKPPYGYVRGDDLRLRPHPEEARIVKLIFEWTIQGMGRTSIANKLTDMGVKSPSGRDLWERTAISWIIHNEVYIGSIVWGKGQWRKNSTGGYRQVREHDRSKWTIKENAHEPLVDVETFKRAQAAGKVRALPVPKDKRITNPLASLVKCGICNRGMRRQPKNTPERKNRFYCDTHKCTNVSTTFELVEDRMLATLKLYLAGLENEMDAKQMKVQPVKEIWGQRLSALEKQLSELKEQSNNIHDLLERRIYSDEKFLERSVEIEARLEQTKVEIAEASANLKAAEQQDRQRNQFIPKLIKVLEVYDSLSAEEKNQLLKEIVDYAIYKRELKTKPDEFTLDVFLKI